VQLFGHRLEAAGDLADLLLARVVLVAAAAGQLQVVDDDEAELLLVARENGLVLAEPPRTRAHLEDGRSRGVVDEELAARDAVGRRDHPPEVVVDELPRAQLRVVDLRLGAQHALDQLGRPHLEREEQDRVMDGHLVLGQLQVPLLRDAGVLRQVQHERRLAHRRARRDDHQVARLQPARHLVEVGEVGLDPRDRVLALGPLGDLDEDFFE
jgi:hypothetical protein